VLCVSVRVDVTFFHFFVYGEIVFLSFRNMVRVTFVHACRL